MIQSIEGKLVRLIFSRLWTCYTPNLVRIPVIFDTVRPVLSSVHIKVFGKALFKSVSRPNSVRFVTDAAMWYINNVKNW